MPGFELEVLLDEESELACGVGERDAGLGGFEDFLAQRVGVVAICSCIFFLNKRGDDLVAAGIEGLVLLGEFVEEA